MTTPNSPDSSRPLRQSASPERVAPEHGGQDFPDGRKPAPLSPNDIDPDDKDLARRNAGGSDAIKNDNDDGDDGAMAAISLES